MRFITLIFRNLVRRGVRTSLTVLGLGVGVSAVVSLLGISWGFERSFMAVYEAKEIDLVVSKAGVGDRLSSYLDESVGDELRRVPGVKRAEGSLVDTTSFEEAHLSTVVISGWVPGGLMFKGLRILEGRTLEPGDEKAVIIGRVLALNLTKKAGEELDISDEKYKIVGVHEADSLFENSGMVMPLSEVQRRMGRPHQVTAFLVSADVKDDKSVHDLGQRIEKAVKGVAASPARDFVMGDNQIRLATAMSWATSAIAMVLGSLGVLNTMMMSVFERTKEIGILRALGWRRTRVLNLILGESVMLGLAGAVLGSVLAFLGVKALVQFPMTRSFINPNLPPTVLALGIVLGVGLSFFGGFYPALRASALDPTEALRHE